MGARIPNIKPGKATIEYLTKIQASTRFWGTRLSDLFFIYIYIYVLFSYVGLTWNTSWTLCRWFTAKYFSHFIFNAWSLSSSHQSRIFHRLHFSPDHCKFIDFCPFTVIIKQRLEVYIFSKTQQVWHVCLVSWIKAEICPVTLLNFWQTWMVSIVHFLSLVSFIGGFDHRTEKILSSL